MKKWYKLTPIARIAGALWGAFKEMTEDELEKFKDILNAV